MSDIQTWLENLPDRGDETLVGVPPSALAELLEERDKLRKEHRAMSKGAQTNAEIAKRQAEKITELREQLRAVTAERDALRKDKKRLDWLARNRSIPNKKSTWPTVDPSRLREGIDAIMREESAELREQLADCE